jgi:hypothetical protein
MAMESIVERDDSKVFFELALRGRKGWLEVLADFELGNDGVNVWRKTRSKPCALLLLGSPPFHENDLRSVSSF